MKTVLVVGASRGIGLGLVKKFKEEGFEVYATCREKTPELEETGVTVLEGVNMKEDKSLLALSERVPFLDYFIHNAGIMKGSALENLKKDFDFRSIEEQFQVNALAPLKLTVALLDKFKEGSKVCFVSSRMGSISDNSSGGSYGYRASKCALNMFSKSLSVDLEEKGVHVLALHPGWVKTRMTGDKGLIDVEESVEGLFERIESLKNHSSGSFLHSNGEVLSW